MPGNSLLVEVFPVLEEEEEEEDTNFGIVNVIYNVDFYCFCFIRVGRDQCSLQTDGVLKLYNRKIKNRAPRPQLQHQLRISY